MCYFLCNDADTRAIHCFISSFTCDIDTRQSPGTPLLVYGKKRRSRFSRTGFKTWSMLYSLKHCPAIALVLCLDTWSSWRYPCSLQLCLDWMTFKDPFKPKLFYGFMILWVSPVWSHASERMETKLLSHWRIQVHCVGHTYQVNPDEPETTIHCL